MFIVDFLVATIIALLFTFVFFVIFRVGGTWTHAITFFIVILLAAWAGGIWISPVGPLLYGVYWIPFLFVGFLFALLLATLIPPRSPRDRKEAVQQAEVEVAAENLFSTFFWVFVIILILSIVLGYMRPEPIY